LFANRLVGLDLTTAMGVVVLLYSLCDMDQVCLVICKTVVSKNDVADSIKHFVVHNYCNSLSYARSWNRPRLNWPILIIFDIYCSWINLL